MPGYGLRSPPERKAGNPEIGKFPGEVSETVCGSRLFLDESEQFSVFRLRQEAIEIPQQGLLRFRVGTEFLHHAATQQFRSALIQFALFLADLFLDRSESFLERIPLGFLLLEQLLFLRRKLGELLYRYSPCVSLIPIGKAPAQPGRLAEV